MAAGTESAGTRRVEGENSAASTESAAVKAKCVLLDIGKSKQQFPRSSCEQRLMAAV